MLPAIVSYPPSPQVPREGKPGIDQMLMQTHEARLKALRQQLKAQGLDGFVIPISDEHMSEYVGAYAQRLQWLTGFGGSAGSAAVLTDNFEGIGAAIFVDGRYTVQVRDQVDGSLFEYRSVPKDTIGGWLADNRSEEHTSEVQSLMRISYAVFCLKKKI